ncbi:hypothetical protein KKH18_07965 [bacterium]|nr:hypothetical protein [bacterium]
MKLPASISHGFISFVGTVCLLLSMDGSGASGSELNMSGEHPRGKLKLTAPLPAELGEQGQAALELSAVEASPEFVCILKQLAEPVEYSVTDGIVTAEWEYMRHPDRTLKLKPDWKVTLTDLQGNENTLSGKKSIRGWDFGPHPDSPLLLRSRPPSEAASLYRFEFGIGDSTIDSKAFSETAATEWSLEPADLQAYIRDETGKAFDFSRNSLRALLLMQAPETTRRIQSLSLAVNDICGIVHRFNFSSETSIVLPGYAPPPEPNAEPPGSKPQTQTPQPKKKKLSDRIVESPYTLPLLGGLLAAFVVFWLSRIHFFSRILRQLAAWRYRKSRREESPQVIGSDINGRLQNIERLLSEKSREYQPQQHSAEQLASHQRLLQKLQTDLTRSFRADLADLEASIELKVVRNLSYLVISILNLEEDVESGLQSDSLTLVNSAAKAIAESRQKRLNRRQFLLEMRNKYGAEKVLLASVTAGSYFERQRITSVVDELEFERNDSEGNWLIIRRTSQDYLLLPIDFSLFADKDSKRAVGMMFNGVVDISESSRYVQVYKAAGMTLIDAPSGDRIRCKCSDKGRVGSELTSKDTSSPRVRSSASELKKAIQGSSPEEIKEKLSQLFRELDTKLPSMVRRVTREMDEIVKVSDLAKEVESRVKSEFESWMPSIEDRISSIQQEVQDNHVTLMEELKRQSELLDRWRSEEAEQQTESNLQSPPVTVREAEAELETPAGIPEPPAPVLDDITARENKAEFERGLPEHWRSQALSDLNDWISRHSAELPLADHDRHLVLIQALHDWLTKHLPVGYTASVEYLHEHNPLALSPVDILRGKAMERGQSGELSSNALLNLVVTINKENSSYIGIMLPPAEYTDTLRFVKLTRLRGRMKSVGRIVLNESECFIVVKYPLS